MPRCHLRSASCVAASVGRDSFAPTRIEERYAETKADFPDVKVAVAILVGHVMLGKYLRKGLALLSQVGVDLDQTSLEPAGTPQ